LLLHKPIFVTVLFSEFFGTLYIENCTYLDRGCDAGPSENFAGQEHSPGSPRYAAQVRTRRHAVNCRTRPRRPRTNSQEHGHRHEPPHRSSPLFCCPLSNTAALLTVALSLVHGAYPCRRRSWTLALTRTHGSRASQRSTPTFSLARQTTPVPRKTHENYGTASCNTGDNKNETPKQTKAKQAPKSESDASGRKANSEFAYGDPQHAAHAAATPRGEMTGNWRSGTLAADR
jgi:hypothetical protein